MKTASCPNRSALLAFSTGELPAETFESVAQHVEHCLACLANLDALAPLADTWVAGLRRPLPADPFQEEPQCREAVARFEAIAWAGARADQSLGLDDAATIEDNVPPAANSPPPLPQQIGRYQVVRRLGGGTFGDVYLAHDGAMRREVAIKVPSRRLLKTAQARAAFLEEVRNVARLRHEGIVQAHEFGEEEGGSCFIVYEYIDGMTLGQRIAQGPLPYRDGALIVARVAEALHHAHLQGLFHRDVKPANILLDCTGKPFVADFGLALKEQNIGRDPRCGGTAAYMSPEQARGEGHRVDGRSDIFSLGAVFYELLTGRRAFGAASRQELPEQVTSYEPRPPRQFDDSLPKELERICLKALSKRASERYTTAKDMADDLRHFLEHAIPEHQQAPQPPIANADKLDHASAPTDRPGSLPTATWDSHPIKIVPKGLRSFDAQDADFFLELVPGPRDREGLPDVIRFWKTHVEETDADNTFAVGLIYGPSGCGKSSLMKAGLLPRLSDRVVAVYLEATAEETETRLLNGLRKRCPGLPSNLGLKDTLAALRRARGVPAGKKVLIVLDQFEQWLHANKQEEQGQLVEALRQCDGANVQCIVMVRDDFWMAATRLMRDLDFRLLEGRNSAAVDLFPIRHAEKVLADFGRAFGVLPDRPGDVTEAQKQFLTQAVSGLAQENQVVCIRLALFAEMMKGKSWTPAALKEVGGTEGVGVTFLKETFSAARAAPKHRLHQKAARAVLKALLPESGTDIKGSMKSRAELLEASGYGNRPEEFDDLIRLLDSEIRLITPTDPEGSEPGSASSSPVRAGQKYYQLTHDYLVPSVRDWLTLEDKLTRSGRARLLLEDLTGVWNARQQNRQLPSLIQWLGILRWTRKKDWTGRQRKMMRRATRYHGVRGLVVAACLALLGFVAWDVHGRIKAQWLHDRLLGATTEGVPGIVEEMTPYRRWINPLLHNTLKAPDNDSKKLLHASLALLPEDPGQVEYVYQRLLQSDPQDFAVIRRELARYKDDVIEQLWKELAAPQRDAERRFRAACALVEYAPGNARWGECATIVVDGLVSANPLVLSYWKDSLEPVRRQLLPALAASLEDDKWNPGDRRAITEFYRLFSNGLPDGIEPLENQLSRGEGPAQAGVHLAKRKATVAAALAALGDGEKVWPLLVHTPNPTLRSYLIERLGSSGIDPKVLATRLERETEVSARRALILTLGGFPPERLADLIPVLLDLYENDPDPGVHAAAGWVLRTWKHAEELGNIESKLATGQAEGSRKWYINKQHQSFTIIEAPGSSVLGAQRNLPESRQHRFAIGATELTVKEFRAFKPDHAFDTVSTTLNSPVNQVSWYDATEYCNWLSWKEGIPKSQWCYAKKIDGVLDFVSDYQDRTGYRLPTEKEWEFAGRAGAQTGWCFGEADDELTGSYAWWFGNPPKNSERRSFPVALLKPNDWGLFDVHGNLEEWCQEGVQDPAFPDDVRCDCRGGAYLTICAGLAFDVRFPFGRKFKRPLVGFRVARTMH
jgi:serine/threonine protein kinase